MTNDYPDNEIRPFRIDIPEQDLDDLRDRLGRTRWANELPLDTSGPQTGLVPPGWEYGVPLSYVKDLVEYWRDGYDWRAWEAKLNEFPQFTTEIDHQHIHFLHIRSPEPDATPLILTHGWPNTMVEYLELLGPLSDPRAYGGDPADAFDLVIPHLPGFGFFGPTTETGWDAQRTAKAWAELMKRLGYERYGAHGNDAGAIVAPMQGRLDPDHVIGVHVNLPNVITPTSSPGASLTAAVTGPPTMLPTSSSATFGSSSAGSGEGECPRAALSAPSNAAQSQDTMKAAIFAPRARQPSQYGTALTRGPGPPHISNLSASDSFQVQHRRAGLRERGREGGIAVIFEGHLAGVSRLAAADAMPPDRVGVGFQPRGEQVALFVGLEDEVLFAGVRERVSGRAEIPPGLHRDEIHLPREAQRIAHRVAGRFQGREGGAARGGVGRVHAGDDPEVVQDRVVAPEE
jgi:Epoxide hydrolase N terminus